MSQPAALAFSTDNCTVGRAMEVLGERWTFVVLREVFNGVRRFEDMRRHSGIPRQVLTNRLALLVDQGILRKEPYRPEGQRARHEYRLTEKGLDLYPVLGARAPGGGRDLPHPPVQDQDAIDLLESATWGDRYLADPEGPPVAFAHRDCAAPVRLHLTCADGHDVADPRAVATVPGPGVKPFS